MNDVETYRSQQAWIRGLERFATKMQERGMHLPPRKSTEVFGALEEYALLLIGKEQEEEEKRAQSITTFLKKMSCGTAYTTQELVRETGIPISARRTGVFLGRRYRQLGLARLEEGGGDYKSATNLYWMIPRQNKCPFETIPEAIPRWLAQELKEKGYLFVFSPRETNIVSPYGFGVYGEKRNKYKIGGKKVTKKQFNEWMAKREVFYQTIEEMQGMEVATILGKKMKILYHPQHLSEKQDICINPMLT